MGLSLFSLNVFNRSGVIRHLLDRKICCTDDCRFWMGDSEQFEDYVEFTWEWQLQRGSWVSPKLKIDETNSLNSNVCRISGLCFQLQWIPGRRGSWENEKSDKLATFPHTADSMKALPVTVWWDWTSLKSVIVSDHSTAAAVHWLRVIPVCCDILLHDIWIFSSLFLWALVP